MTPAELAAVFRDETDRLGLDPLDVVAAYVRSDLRRVRIAPRDGADGNHRWFRTMWRSDSGSCGIMDVYCDEIDLRPRYAMAAVSSLLGPYAPDSLGSLREDDDR